MGYVCKSMRTGFGTLFNLQFYPEIDTFSDEVTWGYTG